MGGLTVTHRKQSFEIGKLGRRRGFVQSIGLLAAGFGLCGSPAVSARLRPPFLISTFNQMTLAVSDPAATLDWYQGLFGMPVAARQGNTVFLQVGDGPQSIAISGDVTDNPRITQFCLGVENFDYQRAVRILAENGVEEVTSSGFSRSGNRMRAPGNGGLADDAVNLVFRDPDGILIQLQDSSYCGGAGVLGNQCQGTLEPAPTEGLFTLGEFNHFTLFVSDKHVYR